MRILKVLAGLVLAVVLVATGVFAVALLAVGLLVYLVVRLVRRPPGAKAPAPRAAPARTAGDVIDVSATEVPAEKPAERPR